MILNGQLYRLCTVGGRDHAKARLLKFYPINLKYAFVVINQENECKTFIGIHKNSIS